MNAMTKTLPATMAAVLLTGHGGPEKLVYRTDVKVPAPAPGEVLVKVTACGMNNTDVWVRQGAYGTEEDAAAVSTWRRQGNTLVFPRIQGTDTVGTIVAVGEGVSPDRVGERVMVDFSIYNRDDDSLADIDYMGHGRDGGYAEYQTVPAQNAHVVDTEMSDVELATFCCAYLTGEQTLERAGLKAGERVLVTGASGGVGSVAIALLAGIGYAVTASTGRPQEKRYLEQLGAVEVIDRGELAAPGKPLQRERWAGAVDSVGSHTLANVCAATRSNGAVAACGLAQGADFPATVLPFILRGVTLYGINCVYVDNAIRARAWELIAGHVVGPRLDQMTSEIGLTQAIDAASALLDGKSKGRIVVDVNR